MREVREREKERVVGYSIIKAIEKKKWATGVRHEWRVKGVQMWEVMFCIYFLFGLRKSLFFKTKPLFCFVCLFAKFADLMLCF